MKKYMKGTLDLLVLKVLQSRPLHGYAIATRIQTLSEEALSVEEGTLYPALHRMERSGWLQSDWKTTDTGRRARVYGLTSEGRSYLKSESAEWRTSTEAIGRVLGAGRA